MPVVPSFWTLWKPVLTPFPASPWSSVHGWRRPALARIRVEGENLGDPDATVGRRADGARFLHDQVVQTVRRGATIHDPALRNAGGKPGNPAGCG